MKNHKWIYLACFFTGALCSYVLSQFTYFDIKKELDVPSLLVNLITIIIGVYIADTLQKRVNRSLNQYSYLISKLDSLWLEFNKFIQKISYSKKLDAKTLNTFNKEVLFSLASLKNIFNAFNLDSECISNLEKELEDFDALLNDMPKKDNIIIYQIQSVDTEKKIVQINNSFSIILKEIQDM